MNRDETWLLEEKYNGEESDEFLADVKRLKNGEPLAYVIGWIPFLDCQIWLDSHPLIPRPETEFWTERAITSIIGLSALTPHPVHILDLCAGSGCVGTIVATSLPVARFDFG
ncbi:MAG: hypothetical protein AAGA35_02840 [Patescibacteria group bacterium]